MRDRSLAMASRLLSTLLFFTTYVTRTTTRIRIARAKLTIPCNSYTSLLSRLAVHTALRSSGHVLQTQPSRRVACTSCSPLIKFVCRFEHFLDRPIRLLVHVARLLAHPHVRLLCSVGCRGLCTCNVRLKPLRGQQRCTSLIACSLTLQKSFSEYVCGEMCCVAFGSK